LALPVCVAVISPLADLTFSGASIEERKHLDPLVTREMLESTVTDYLAGADGVYLCRAARIRRRRRTPGDLLQNPSRTLGVGKPAVIELPS
jgi:hypothetical protein